MPVPAVTANKEMHLPGIVFPRRGTARLPGRPVRHHQLGASHAGLGRRRNPCRRARWHRVQRHTAGCPAPRGVAELGEEVWRSDRPLPERGFTALGVPIGHGDYVREWGHSAACGKSRRCWTICIHLPHLPGLQCAWLLLRTCVSTRANHTLRNIPPEDVRPYAEGHSAKRGLAGMPHVC